MSQISSSSSSSEKTEKRDKGNFYTVREEEISYHAKEISKKVKDCALLEIQWTDVIKRAGIDIDCLIVFVTGSSNCNRVIDVLSGIREQAPKAQSIIAVIICTYNIKEHGKYCSSIENHIFRTEKDISFEYFMFSDGSPHECSNNIDKCIEFHMKSMDKEPTKGQTNETDRIKEKAYENGKERNVRAKMNELVKKAKQSGKTKGDLDNLEKLITEFSNLNLKDNGDLSVAKYILDNGRMEIELKDAILRRRKEYLEKAIKKTKESGFVCQQYTLLLKAEKLLHIVNQLSNLGANSQ